MTFDDLKKDLRNARLRMFHTYASFEELQDYIDKLPEKEKAVAALIFGMTYNTTLAVITEILESDDDT